MRFGALHRTRPALLALSACLCAGLLATPAAAARARSLGLADMGRRAERIFAGRCLERAVILDAATRLPVTVYTFEVTEAVKGVSPGVTRFRMLGTPEAPFLAGLEGFEAGEEALLLLYPASASGFTSPMGGGQGRFGLVQDPTGARRAVGRTFNAALLDDVPESVLKAHGLERGSGGPLPLQPLLGVLRAISGRPPR